MIYNQRHPIRFSGYTLEKKSGQAAPLGEKSFARPFLPGHYNGGKGQNDVYAQVTLPGSEQVKKYPMEYDGHQWNTKDLLPLGSAYRFMVNGKPELDRVEWTERTVEGKPEIFNQISPHEDQSPKIAPLIVNIMSDSLLSRTQMAGLAAGNNGILPYRTHFNQFGGNEEGLLEIIGDLKRIHVGGILWLPFIGGDTYSSHGYWTVDPFSLNNSFSDRKGLKKVDGVLLKYGMKKYSDAAFVNQGLNGVQYLSLLGHGFRSPYWSWFPDSVKPRVGGPMEFPQQAFKKMVLGILPTVEDETRPGHRRVAYERFAFRVINDPNDKANYRPDDWTFLQTYDPNTETADGRPLKPDYDILNFQDSMQKQWIPLTPEMVKELQRKRAELQRYDRRSGPDEGLDAKKLLTEMTSFRLDQASMDNSLRKWNGNIDTVKMNLRNPEVLDYFNRAVAYWGRFFLGQNTLIVAQAMNNACRQNPKLDKDYAEHPERLIEAVTLPTGSPVEENADPNRVLAPVTLPDFEVLTKTEALDAMSAAIAFPAGETAPRLSKALVETFPLSAVDLPIRNPSILMFKAILSHPRLPGNLRKNTLYNRIIGGIFAPMARLPMVGGLFAALRDIIQPKPFSRALQSKLKEIVDLLPPESREKLRYEKVQSLVLDDLGQNLYLDLLTGLNTDSGDSPEKIYRGLLDTVPAAIRMADPETAAEMLPRFLKKRLKSIDTGHLARLLDARLRTIEPRHVYLAEAVLQKRELGGLNQRNDAAGDAGNRENVFNAEPEDRAELFITGKDNETDFLQKCWSTFADTIRQIFPKAAILGEWTDIEKLCNEEHSKDKPLSRGFFRRIFGSNAMTSLPAMSYAYSQPHQLTNFAQRPDEFGASQMTPSQFDEHCIADKSRSLPATADRQSQNMTASPDYMTSTHALMVNPRIFTYDLEPYYGLRNDLNEACAELLTKACFKKERDEELKIPELKLKEALSRLQDIVYCISEGQEPPAGVKPVPLPAELMDYIDAKHKEDSGKVRPTPRELKPEFVDDLFDRIDAGVLGLDDSQHRRLRESLKKRMWEPSAAKAMRAVINNALLDMSWDRIRDQAGLDDGGVAHVAGVFREAVFAALDKTIQRFDSHFGHQPPDLALAHVFQAMDLNWINSLPFGRDADALKSSILKGLYDTIMRPVMEKQPRLFAVQDAIPGTPSIYLPDLFAQGGGELSMNKYVQCRNIIRVDKLDDPNFREAFEKNGEEVFSPRTTVTALHNGFRSPVPQDDENGVLTVIRDNGKEQFIRLVNTGKPTMDRTGGIKPNDLWSNRIGYEPDYYSEIQLKQPTLEKYVPVLKSPYLVAGTIYRDMRNNRRYRLEEDGRLLDINDPARGMDIGAVVNLIREKWVSGSNGISVRAPEPEKPAGEQPDGTAQPEEQSVAMNT